MGGTNPEEIRRVLKLKNVSTVQCDRLHGKVYLFSNEMMVGSSNASTNGLSFEGTEASGWSEANIVSAKLEEILCARDWIKALDCHPISKEDLRRARTAWESRRRAMLPLKRDQSISELLKDSRSSLGGKGVYAAFYAADMTKSGHKELENKQKETGSEIDAFQDWIDLPRDVPIISFRLSKNGELIFDNVWRVLPASQDGMDKDGLTMQWCFKSPLPLGLKNPRSDYDSWKLVADWIVKHKGKFDDEQGQFCDLSEVTL
ncbi:hypothetical protein [uncultured Sphingomonas sp.]|uniref:hypothetical protein n=1 Tax=uncultured Sphingomonas sp. TaxID=158754 RepID=UPI0035C94793